MMMMTTASRQRSLSSSTSYAPAASNKPSSSFFFLSASSGLPGALGSGIGTDVEMIAANHRQSNKTATTTVLHPIPAFANATSYSHQHSSSCYRRSFHNESIGGGGGNGSARVPPTIQISAVAATVSLKKNTTVMSTAAIAPWARRSVITAYRSVATSAAAGAAASNGGGSAMKDEYGSMDSDGDTFVCPDFVLESGVHFPCQLRYKTYGQLNPERDNCVVVCHALTGNASLHAWWGDLLGENRPFDTGRYFVVCCNILGSCYGSTSPASTNPATGQPYGLDYPDVSVQDTVRLQLRLLREALNISSVKAVIGGSFGGMQAVEFAVQAGSTVSNDDADFLANSSSTSSTRPFVRSVVPIACGAQHTAWQIAISEVQRQAIYKDPSWSTDPFGATRGLEVARQIGMVSYRTPRGYCDKFGRHMQPGSEVSLSSSSPPYGSLAPWKVKSYLEYQGSKFLTRFDPVTYVKLTEQMDSHDVTRGRPGGLEQVLGRVEIPALVLGIDSDVLYPLYEQEELARYLPNATLKVIHSIDGHDGFLLEQDQVGRHITDFLLAHN
jgi:homoserine O-acetyltransferase